MKKLFLLIGLFSFCFIKAQDLPLSYYLPSIEYNKSIPTPKDFLGYQIGDWHISHDQLNHYMRKIAEVSDRVVIEDYARSHEGRPLFLMVFGSENNMRNLAAIKQERKEIYKGKASKKRPVVIYQGYSIHGNESSGANAAALMAYHLAAGKGTEIQKLLEEAIVIIDPCFNPDGLHRFSTWVNSHKSKTLVSDPNHREFHEVWPGGRTNHYWFDLNRDWLPAVHPESQGRLSKFHEWKPNILTDHHEMGSHNTYFFQPGIPSRTNPLTPTKNQDLTYDIANFHAKQLDEIGSLYYTRESFDDFYIGKGSTYPDMNGCIGILFEQASSRGHLRETNNGILSFPFTIRNQVATSLSTQKAGIALKDQLIDFQDDFYKDIGTKKDKSNVKGYSFSEKRDKSKLNAFLTLLRRHQIDIYQEGEQYLVPVNQAQKYLIKSMFEPVKTFTDSLFYDVSTWNLPMAFNIDSKTSSLNFNEKNKLKEIATSQGQMIGSQSKYAYVFKWDDYDAPKLLYHLQNLGLRTKVSSKNFTAMIEDQEIEFIRGAIIVPIQNQNLSAQEIFNTLNAFLKKSPIEIYGLKTGLSIKGTDVGSPSMYTLKKPQILLVAGEGATSYDVGEIWHLLDTRYEMPITIVENKELSSTELSKYNVIVLANGSYRAAPKLLDWLEKGNTLIVFRSALQWAAAQKLINAKVKAPKIEETNKRRPYEKASSDHGADYLGGAIFEVELDLTHPIAFGYHNKNLPVFKKGTLVMETSKNPYATPGVYTANPLLSGYISKKNLDHLKSTAAIIVSGHGKGRTIGFTDNTNFRGFWYGTNKLFANAIFFGEIIGGSTVERD